MTSPKAPTDFQPTPTWEMLRQRADLLQTVRSFFVEREFLEVDTPILSRDTVVDRHLDPIPVNYHSPAGIENNGRPMYLQTSPEFAMKRLLAAASPSIYQIARVFRHGELGARHNPEFTMVEWYRLGDDMKQATALVSDLVEQVLNRGKARVLTYRDAFLQALDFDPHTAHISQLIQYVDGHGMTIPQHWTRDDRDVWLDLIAAEFVFPTLGLKRPTILCDYPASQAALAKVVRRDGVKVAERFEVFVDGMELANGYHELLDPRELQNRNQTVNKQRVSDGKKALPEDSRLIAAMKHGLPPSIGVALGFDRLLMLASGAQSIQDVIPFPFDRA